MNAKKILAVLSFVLIAIFLMGCNQEDQVLTPEDSLQKVLLTPEETDGVIQMIWSEKLAFDVYTILSGNYAEVFSTIADSEVQHMTKLIYMLDRHTINVPNPIAGAVDGEFPDGPDGELQTLYNDALAISSYEEALQLGMEIETLLKTSYEDILAAVDVEGNLVVTNPSLLTLYGSLLDGSEKHLEAFTK